MTDVAERLRDLRDRGLYRRLRLIEGPQGPRVLLDGRRCCCSARTTTSASPTIPGCARRRPRRRCAGAPAPAPRAWSAATWSRTGSWRRAWPRSRATRRRCCSAPATSPTAASSPRWRAPARSSSPTSSTTPASSTAAGSRGPRPSSTATATSSTSPGDCAEAAGRAALIVSDGVFSMDGDVAPLPQLAELARRHGCRLMVDEAHATGALGPGGRGSVAAAGLSGEVDVVVGTLGKALGSYGAYACADARDGRLPPQQRPLLHLLHRPATALGRRRRGGAGAGRTTEPGRAPAGATPPASAPRSPPRASAAAVRRPRSCRSRSARRRRRWRSASACSNAASSPRGSGRRPSPPAPRACASRSWPRTRPGSWSAPPRRPAPPPASSASPLPRRSRA